VNNGKIMLKSWPADIDSLSSIFNFIETIGKRAGFSSHKISRIHVAVEEVVVNIIKHAFKDPTGEFIHIEAQDTPQYIIFRIIDSAPPFDPLSVPAPPMDTDLTCRQIGGLGLLLAREFSDQVTYTRHNKKNIFELTFLKGPQ